METTPLVGTYKRYKAGTEKLIKWLSDSANACDAAAVPQPTKNSKSSRATTRKVRVDELFSLALKIVAAIDPTIDIPPSILDCAKDTITGRQQSARWYADKGDAESNITHRYFLTKLEKIFDLLRTEAKRRRPKRKKKIELATDTNDLSNVFLHLELEDPTSGDTEPSEKPTTPPKRQQRVELEMSEDEIKNEKQFAIWCMMDDFYKLRVHVRGTWQQYKRGDLSLPTTCEITEKAFHIMYLLQDEFVAEHSALKLWEQVLHCIGFERYVRNARGVEPWVCCSPDHEHDGPSATCHSDRLCMPAWCALEDLNRLSQWIRSDRPTSASTARPFYVFPGNPYAKALLNAAAELVNLSSNDTAKNGFDGYTSGLLAVASNEITTYGLYGAPMLVATQIHMDIWDVLEGHTDCAMLEASVAINRGHEIISGFAKFAANVNSEESCRPIIMDVSWDDHNGKTPWSCSVDQVQDGRTGWISPTDGPSPVFFPSNVLAILPVFCGVVMFLEQVGLHTRGGLPCEGDHFLLAAAHLYKAATVQGSLDAEWEDLDSLVARQNTRGSFIRNAESVTLVAKNYCLALGVPLAQVAGKHKPMVPSDHVCHRKSTKMQTTSLWYHSSNKEYQINTPFRFFYECARGYMKYHQAPDTRLAAQWEQTKKLTPCQMLFIVQEVLVEDEPYLNFDLFRFAERLIDFCMEACDVLVWDRGSPTFPNNRPPTPYVFAAEILWDAASAETRGGRQRLHEPTILQIAAQGMRKFIEQHGREGIDEAMRISSGHIANDLKPAVRYGIGPGGPSTPTSYPGILDVPCGVIGGRTESLLDLLHGVFIAKDDQGALAGTPHYLAKAKEFQSHKAVFL